MNLNPWHILVIALAGWMMRDPDLWPETLTRELFLEWFDCELSTMIWDMLKTRLKPAF